MGLFADDTRFLSRWILTINGERPLQLSSDKVEYYSAAFFLRNPVAGGLEQDMLSIGRDRFIGDGMQEHIVVAEPRAASRGRSSSRSKSAPTSRTSLPSRSTTSRSGTRTSRRRFPASRLPSSSPTATSSSSRTGRSG